MGHLAARNKCPKKQNEKAWNILYSVSATYTFYFLTRQLDQLSCRTCEPASLLLLGFSSLFGSLCRAPFLVSLSMLCATVAAIRDKKSSLLVQATN